MKYIYIIIIFFISCDFKKNNDELKFVSNNFKDLINNAIDELQNNKFVEFKDLLIHLELFKNDTLLHIDNSPPYELDNLKIVKDYRGYKIYFYVDASLDKSILNKLIEFNNKEIMLSDKSILIDYETYSYYSNGFLIKNKKIYEIELPLIWSTDSTYNLKSFDRFIKEKN